jgi:hypothetical protein
VVVLVIIGMPPQDIVAGIPAVIMAFIMSQHAFMSSICEPSVGVILQTMPSLVISRVILHIIMPRMPPIIGMGIGIIMGIGMPIMPFIMFGIMPLIIPGIMPPMPGIMPLIGIIVGIGIPIIPFIGIIPPIGDIGIGIIDMGISGIIGAFIVGLRRVRWGSPRSEPDRGTLKLPGRDHNASGGVLVGFLRVHGRHALRCG